MHERCDLVLKFAILVEFNLKLVFFSYGRDVDKCKINIVKVCAISH